MAAAVRVGVLNDMADPGAGLGGAPEDMTEWLEREVDSARAAGRITAPVEFVHAYGLGLPSGTAEAIEKAYQDLVDQDVVLIVGPGIGDNALIATPLAERLRVPTINWAGAERARGKYMFHLQVGSYDDESLVIARHLCGLGARRLGVVHDVSASGTRHLRTLQDEATILGIEIVAAHGLSPLTDNTAEEVASVLAAAPDAFVYLGVGSAAVPVAESLSASGWRGPRMMNTAGCSQRGDSAKLCEGWSYVDMYSDGNHTLTALRATLNIPDGGILTAAKGHDLGRLVAEAIARARDISREGLRLGLEQVRWLPAAEGEEGTLLGFGLQDRGALHGRYLVVRQWQGGRSVEVSAHTS